MKKSELKLLLDDAEDEAERIRYENNRLQGTLKRCEADIANLRDQLQSQRTLLDKDNRLFASYDATVMSLREEILALKAAKGTAKK